MRPINKGETPRTYKRYQDAQTDLVTRIGKYCSYCERPIKSSLAVEHIQPKSKYPNLERDWDNFLLGCSNCNSSKSAKDVQLADYVWPHLDNTFLAIQYLEAGRVTFNPHFRQKAQNIIELTGLDKEPGHPNLHKRPTQTDYRWSDRKEVWDIAKAKLKKLQNQELKNSDTEDIREIIVELAQATGMFSIWMKIFEDDIDMKRRFIEAFAGTKRECFDANGRAIDLSKRNA